MNSRLRTLAMALLFPVVALQAANQTMTFPSSGGTLTSASFDVGTNWYLVGTGSPDWITELVVQRPGGDFFGDSALKSPLLMGSAVSVILSGSSATVKATVEANPTSSSRSWDFVVRQGQGGPEVYAITIVQAGLSAQNIGSGTGSGAGASVLAPGTDLAFGPGEASEFMISANEKALVVGVSGLNWNNFKSREYKGEGHNGQYYRVFDDNRVIDIEKNSTVENNASHATDDYWCEGFSELDCLLWSGWMGTADGETIAANMRQRGDQFCFYDYLQGAFSGDYQDTPTTWQGIANGFAAADRLYRTCVVFENYIWKGSRGVGHCVVCCGYSYDPAKPATDPSALKGLFIIDPDNDMYNGAGGSSAPNSITYCPVSWNATRGSLTISNVFGTTGEMTFSNYGDWLGFRTQTTPTLHKTSSSDLPGSGSGSGSAEGVISPTQAQTVGGAIWDGERAIAAVQVKFAKATRGKSKVSASIIDLAGKKDNSKRAVPVDVGGNPEVRLEFKKHSALQLTLGNKSWAGDCGGLTATSSSAQMPGSATFVLEGLGDLSSVLKAGERILDYSPNGEQVSCQLKKWKVVNKAGKVEFNRKAGRIETNGVNLTGLKLTYTASSGTFKGSFKVWIANDQKSKVRSVTLSVTGIVANGVGYGQVTYKKQVVGQVTVR